VPEEFHLEIEERLKQRHMDKEHADRTAEQFEFHARPVPKAILDGQVVSNSFVVYLFCFFCY